LSDRGRIQKGQLADFQAYSCSDYREILYHQGKLKPSDVWKNGKR
jgi:imidazolonepropionase